MRNDGAAAITQVMRFRSACTSIGRWPLHDCDANDCTNTPRGVLGVRSLAIDGHNPETPTPTSRTRDREPADKTKDRS